MSTAVDLIKARIKTYESIMAQSQEAGASAMANQFGTKLETLRVVLAELEELPDPKEDLRKLLLDRVEFCGDEAKDEVANERAYRYWLARLDEVEYIIDMLEEI